MGRGAYMGILAAFLAVCVTQLYANPHHVVLDSDFCFNISRTEIVCNYTSSMEKEVILTPAPKGCDVWKVLKLIGAEKLEVTVSCFEQIIISSSREVNVAVYEGKEQPERTLSIDHSIVTSVDGKVGRVYLEDSNVTSLTASSLTDLDLRNTWIGSLEAAIGYNHDCVFANSTIEVIDRLQLVGDKPITMTGSRVGVMKNLTFISTAASKLEHVVIDRVPKRGLWIRNGTLTFTNVTFKSLESEAIVVESNVLFEHCTIESASFDSILLYNEGTLSVDNSSIAGSQVSFLLASPGVIFPFNLIDYFRGFSTASMVGSSIAGGFIVLLLTLIVFIIFRHRLSRIVPTSHKDFALIPKDFKTSPYDEVKPPTEDDLGRRPLQSNEQTLPPPPPPPTEEGDEDNSKTSLGRKPPSPSLGQGQKLPSRLPPRLVTGPQPPSRLPPGLGQAPKLPSGPPPGLGQAPKLPSGPSPGLGQAPQPPSGPSPGLSQESQAPGARLPQGLLLKQNQFLGPFQEFPQKNEPPKRLPPVIGRLPQAPATKLKPRTSMQGQGQSLYDDTSVQDDDYVNQLNSQECYDDVSHNG